MTGHWTDPLGDEDPFPPEGCDCEHGWRHVGPDYPATMFPGDLPGLQAQLADLVAQVHAGQRPSPALVAVTQRALDSLTARRATAAESVFPCPRCRPTQYLRWRNGCYRANHHRRACRTCGPNAKTTSTKEA